MFAIGITPHVREKLRFTRPHLASDVYAITTRSNRRIRSWADIDQPGVIAAVAQRHARDSNARQAETGGPDLTRTPHEREQEVLESGRTTCSSPISYSRRMLEKTDWARLVAPTGPYTSRPTAGR